MKIGLASDAHGRTRALESALKLLVQRGAQAVIFCGDIGSDECIEALGSAGVPAHAVAGNMDQHVAGELFSAARRAGVHFNPNLIALPLDDGRMLAATHGHDSNLLHRLVGSGVYAFVCHGHTHRTRNEEFAGVRVINPGALAHPRGPVQTCALLDASTGEVEFIEVD